MSEQINTTEKGTLFELRVFNVIKSLMLKGEFVISYNGSEVFHKKPYYSAKRKSDIVFDIAVECRRTPEKDPFLFIIIECKDYGKTIPVDDIEEFYQKIDQVTGKNVKGIFFSTNSFARGAVAFAESSGIAVVRMLDDDSLSWIVERSSPYLKTTSENALILNAYNAITEENFVSTRQSFFALDNNQPFGNMETLIKATIQTIPEIFK